MPAPKPLILEDPQVKELSWVRDHHPKPHLQMKAAAILKVAHGTVLDILVQSRRNKKKQPHDFFANCSKACSTSRV